MSSPLDLTAPHTHSDCALVLEGQRIYVQKGYLAFHSPVFDTLFFGDFAEKGEKEIEIKEVAYKEMLDMLQVLCRAGAAIEESNVLHILKLADQFQVQALVKECEDFLCTSFIPFKTLLPLADQYGLDKLLEKLIDNANAERIREAQQEEYFHKMKSSTKDDVINRLLGIIEQPQWRHYRSPSY